MNQPGNVLITSVSKKISIIEATRAALSSLNFDVQIIGADLDKQPIASFFVDQFWHMPKLDSLPILSFIEVCKQKHIRWILPTRDGELSYFALHKKTLEEANLFCMISSPQTIETSLDKLKFYQKLDQNALPCIFTTKTPSKILKKYLVVKERFGAGSHSLGLCLTKKEALLHANSLQEPIFQPFIEGEEFSVDLYCPKEGHPLGIIARRREKVVQGESQITTSVSYPNLEKLCSKAAFLFSFFGHLVFQVIEEAQTKKLFFVEVNPRIGGASSLSFAMGLHSLTWFFLETLGIPLENFPFKRAKTEKKQVRYPKDLILDV